MVVLAIFIFWGGFLFAGAQLTPWEIIVAKNGAAPSAPAHIPDSKGSNSPATRAAGRAATGSMITARVDHTSTLLHNGKVLIVGGLNTEGGPFDTAELYDPATGAWSPTGSLAAGRSNHIATMLPNGKVLVAGGYSAPGVRLASAELYDPTTGTWSATGSMINAREGLTATLLGKRGVRSLLLSFSRCPPRRCGTELQAHA